MAKTSAHGAWRVTSILAVWGLAVVDVHAQAARSELLLPYSNDPVSLDDAVGLDDGSVDDGIAAQVAIFSGSLDERLRLTVQQQARMVEIWKEERAALTRTLAPTAASADRQRRALDKGIALDDRGLELMQQSLDRMLARLTEVLSTEQLQRFAGVEQQKLDAQARFLRLKR